LPPLAMLALLFLGNCSSIADFGRLRSDLVADDIHAWVGEDAAQSVGAPVSLNNLTEDELALRDLAFPLIEPPYDRIRWDAVLYEYGVQHSLRREEWVFDPAAYYGHLQTAFHRSTAGRYNQLIDDVRNDIVRIEPFFATARRVVALDERRQRTMQSVRDLSPVERGSALARVAENSLTIAWVHHSLTERCASYRYALDHLTVAEPAPAAAEAARLIAQLQQRLADNELVPGPHIAPTAVAVVKR